MNWQERLRFVAPEITRPGSATQLAGLAIASAPFAMHGPAAGVTTFLVATGTLHFGHCLLLFSSPDRTQNLLIRRRRQAYHRRLGAIRRRRKNLVVPYVGRFLPDAVLRNYGALPAHDYRIVRRIEQTVDAIERQFDALEPRTKRSLLSVLDQVITQAGWAMEVTEKLSLLLEFLAREDLDRLHAEESALRQQAHSAPPGPLATMYAQTCRFKAQQIANLLNAQANTILYRTQLQAIEAGLGNVRGRMASIAAFHQPDLHDYLDALNAEIYALDESLRLAYQATSTASAYYHAGGNFGMNAPVHTRASEPPRETAG